MVSTNFSVAFPDEILNLLDTMRGDVTRSRFLQNLVIEAWKNQNYPKHNQQLAVNFQ